jgi:hypothetical protein
MSARCARRGFASALALLVALARPLACGAQDNARPAILPLPSIFYSPETGFGAGGMAMLTWPPVSRGEGRAREQSCGFGGYYTQNRQALAWASAELFARDGASKLGLAGKISRYPSRFFGIGPAAASDEACLPIQASCDASLGFLLAPDLYAGPRLRLAGAKMLEVEAGGLLDGGSILGSAAYLAAGAGLGLCLDARDSSIAPTRGLYLDLAALGFPPVIAGSVAQGQASIDARAYLDPSPGLVLAAQAWAAAALGDAPFQELPKIGGDRLLRGYYEGRYRDAWAAALQAEIRIAIWWRLGLSLFGGIAQVAGSPAGFGLEGLKAAGGAGLRCRLDDASGANLRVDFAWADEGLRCYFNFGEAF